MAPVHCAAGSDGETNFRRHLACGAERRVIERCQILLHCPARRCRIAILVPVFTGARPLLVGVGDNQTGIDHEAFAPPTRPAAMHLSTTCSNTRRKMSLSRKRSFLARENAEWSGIASSMFRPPPAPGCRTTTGSGDYPRRRSSSDALVAAASPKLRSSRWGRAECNASSNARRLSCRSCRKAFASCSKPTIWSSAIAHDDHVAVCFGLAPFLDPQIIGVVQVEVA